MKGCVPWPDEFVELYKKKGHWKDKTLGEHFDQWVLKYGDNIALIHNNKEITYRQMGVYVTRLAYQLTQMGINTYDRVMFQLFNGPEVVYLFYACTKIGAIPICSLATHRWAEISQFCKQAEPRCHAIPAGTVMDFDYEEFAEEIRAEAPSLEFVLTAGKPARPNMVSINDLIEIDIDLDKAQAVLENYRPDPMEPALFQLSGGTTGVPKIIPRTHNDYQYNTKVCAARFDYDQDTRLVVPVPLTHNAPLSFMTLPTHLSGGTVVITAPKPEEIISAVMANGVNYLPLGAAFVKPILSIPKEEFKKIFGGIKKAWLSSIRPEDVAQVIEATDWECYQLFGMAEGFGAVTLKGDRLEVQINTQGRPLSEDDEVKIISVATGKELAPGEIGEMICRGPYTIRGYYKAEDRNKDAFTPDGFYRSGDLCKLDEEGNLTWCGRIKDCIDRGGEKVNAEEVENHIVKFPKVNQVAVVAMPDEKFGEKICAYVIPQNGESFSLEELREYLIKDRKIAKFKAPERLEFIDAFPVTKVGKLDKKALREKIDETLKEERKI